MTESNLGSCFCFGLAGLGSRSSFAGGFRIAFVPFCRPLPDPKALEKGGETGSSSSEEILMTVLELLTCRLTAKGALRRDGEKDGGRLLSCCSALTTFETLDGFSLPVSILCLFAGGCSITDSGRVE